MIRHVHHVSLTVSNLERSLQFYGELGFSVISVRHGIEEAYFRAVIGYPEAIVHNALMRGADGLCLELMQYVKPEGIKLDLATPNVGSAHICFIVDDLQAIVEELAAKGVSFRSHPVRISSGPNEGGFAVYMLDPDGYTMELFQPVSTKTNEGGLDHAVNL